MNMEIWVVVALGIAVAGLVAVVMIMINQRGIQDWNDRELRRLTLMAQEGKDDLARHAQSVRIRLDKVEQRVLLLADSGGLEFRSNVHVRPQFEEKLVDKTAGGA